MAESGDYSLTPDEMRDWLLQEVRDLTKAVDLRMRDATEFVTAYAVGKITQAEAMDRMSRYELRWGDSPIPGVTTNSKMADEEILRLIDEKWASRLRGPTLGRGNERLK